MPMPHDSAGRSFARLVSDCIFVPLALVYSLAAAAFGCSGSVSVGNSPPPDPNRALGTFEIAGTVPESESTVFFGYWIDGDSGIPPIDGFALRDLIGPVLTDASISIVPNSILYEETATEIATGHAMTVSISGTWTYDGQSRISVNWGNAIVTESTFPATPPFALAAVGTQLQAPQSADLVFANGAWTQLTNVAPGPMDVAFVRVN
jgi:hypothetical protein